MTDTNALRKRLVVDWFRRARESQYVHWESSNYYSKRHYVLGIPATIFGVIAGSSAFTSLNLPNGSLAQYITLVSSLASSLLVTLNTFLNLSELSEKHKSAAVGYSSIRRKLERIETSNLYESNEFDFEIEQIQKELDTLASTSPNAPKNISNSVRDALKSKTHSRIFTLENE